ncbi:MAG: ABC transporter ATP-binding protein [Sterolibacterium sp.]|nr:ABC transporter ATP-binding protein [Sterolibacterium sp.]
MASGLISVRQGRKYFGDIQAVDGVDLDIEAGEIFGLIGHNGAGKSTLFKMLLGLLPVTSGEIHIHGQAVTGAGFREVRRQIGYLPENVVLYDNLSGLETLHFFADLKGVDRAQAASLLEKVGLTHAAGRRVRGYSKGMRQRLGFAQALLGQPKLLFLDEPTNGLDPEGIREFYRILNELKAEGTTIVITSHILAEIQERVDRLAILKLGKVQALGTLQSLREQNDLPLQITVHLADDTVDHLRAALGGLATAGVQVVDEQVRLQCRRQDKMAVLQALAALDGQVLDVHVREPSLEDVFLGYAG